MAGLISTGIWGFICSMLPTGERDEKGRPIMAEHFNTGFAGWGWKIWKTVAGFFRLEIDELVVRRTMTIFELLIQKIRAVKGAMAITQANGKIKSVELSADETFYLLTLEEEDMSFVEYDFIRCQEFTASQRFYHVEVASVLGGVIRVPASEFEGSSIPLVGDEIVQFGNSSHEAAYAGRHSAIYMHADESGQPAIDVMFNIYSKDWTRCVKTRVGGDIPGSGGLKGFYCENGMIKGVDSTGHTVYCIYPDGSAMFGDGSAMFDTDKSGYIAGGAIAWKWNAEKKKYVCTMKDVVLTWDNLDDEAKENLKGEPGSDGTDANLLPWIEKWNGYATELGEEYIVTPKMFSGTKSADGKLTGIAQGKDCITIDGKKRTGIFALVDNEVVFELDPLNKTFLFKGRVEANEGVFKGKVDIAGGKILLNEDGSGQLAGGGLFWDANGVLYTRNRARIAWREIVTEMNDAEVIDGAVFDVNPVNGTYLDIHTSYDDTRIINLISPDVYGSTGIGDDVDVRSNRIGRLAGDFRIMCNLGSIILRDRSEVNPYIYANTIGFGPSAGAVYTGTLRLKWLDGKYNWLAEGDFIKLT